MEEKPEPGWITRVRRSPIILAFVGIAAFLTSVAALTENTDKILIWLGLKPNALQVAADKDARAHFSRDLSRLMWYRYWLMFRYLALVKGKNPEADRERAWNKYSEILEDWNHDLMVNELSVVQYYGRKKYDEFARIGPQFTVLHACLEGLRTPTSSFHCQLAPDRNIAELEKGLRRLRHDIFCFATALPESATAVRAETPAQETLAEKSCD